MAEQFKLDGHGNCTTCSKVPTAGESIQCYSCNGHFHAICNGAGPDDRVATKTMITSFLLQSTKRNFKFYCNVCLTNLEISKTETDGKRVDILEDKMNDIDAKMNSIVSELTKINGIDKQLGEIKKVLTDSNAPSPKSEEKKKHRVLPEGNVWADANRLAAIKVPEPKAVLVISKDTDSQKHIENQSVIEKIVMDNEIPLMKTHRSDAGDVVLVCETKEARDTLKNLVHNANNEILMNSPNEKQVPITIVGLPKDCSHEEAIRMLVLQNQFIKKFSTANKIDDHIKIHTIKPLRNKPSVFQIFASVSPVLREGLRIYKNKVAIGLVSCKVYDRKQTKRCNNCQKFGHFAKGCPTPSETHCGKCSGEHRTDSCTVEEKKCINCVRNNITDSNHPVYFYKCPSLVQYQDHLNSNREKNKGRT